MIESIEIHSFGSIKEPVVIRTGRITLIRGGNDAGKSMICHAIMLGLTAKDPLPPKHCRDTTSAASILLRMKHPFLGKSLVQRKFQVGGGTRDENYRFVRSELTIDGAIRPDIGVLDALFCPIYFCAYGDPDLQRGGDIPEARFLDVCARILGFGSGESAGATEAVREILTRVNQREDRKFRSIEHRDEGVHLQHWDESYVFPYDASGTSDKLYLLSDFVMEAAPLVAQHRQVLLMLDDFPTAIAPLQGLA